MAYLWRRFGPPWRGTDDYKKLAAWVLTTSDPAAFLELHLTSWLSYSAAYSMDRDLYDFGDTSAGPDLSNWRMVGRIVTRVNQALYDAMKELERPVYVRDVAIG